MHLSRAFIPLLLLSLFLSLAAVALIINGALRLPAYEEIARACAERFPEQQPSPTCPEHPTPIVTDVVTVSPTRTYPGFSYPRGFTAIAEETSTGTTLTLAGGGLFFLSCSDCSEIIATLRTAPFVLEGSQTLDSFVQAMYANNSSVTLQKDVHGNGTKYTITGNALHEPFGPFTHVRFFGATTEASVFLPESDLLPVGTVERDTFLSSLDFSLIP